MDEKQTWPGEFMTERQPIMSNDHLEGVVSPGTNPATRAHAYGDGVNGSEEENETLV